MRIAHYTVTTALLWLLANTVAACSMAISDSSRIAVAGGSLTEIIYLLNAQQRIVALDTTSNFPAATQSLPSIGYVRNLSAEGILSMKPTAILGEDDMGPPEVVKQLVAAGLSIAKVPEVYTPQGIIEKVRCVASLLQLQTQAEALITSQLQPVITTLNNYQRDHKPLKIALLLGLRDGVPLAAGSNTSGDGFIKMINGHNVFASIEGWKPISLESMASANPDYIIIPQRGVDTAGGIDVIANHLAVRLTNAGKHQRILVLDGMAMLGFSPRTLTTAETVLQQLQKTRVLNQRSTIDTQTPVKVGS